MLKLHLENGSAVELKDRENSINNRDQLVSVFSGTACIFYDKTIRLEEHRGDPMRMLFDIETDINIAVEYGKAYQRITKAEWDITSKYETPLGGYTENTFEIFVQKLMNKYSQEDVIWCYDVVQRGCNTGIVSELIYTTDVMKILAEHSIDIEHKIQEIAKEFDDSEAVISLKDFTFCQLIYTCFESTVKETLRALDLGDI